MAQHQTGILLPLPAQGLYLEASLIDGADVEQVVKLLESIDLDTDVIGLGDSLVKRFNCTVPGLRTMPEQRLKDIHIPSMPSDLWCWLRGEDQGDLLHRSRRIAQLLAPAFKITDTIEAFRFHQGLDLTGYEDGTENPVDKDALEAAILESENPLINGSSFVAIQKWQHNLNSFDTFSTEQQDHIIGRRRSDNEELEDAPESAHVKRTAQESFEPEAFLLRRSMPWSRNMNSGLMFVAFGHSFDAFEAQLHRMIGKEDDIEDALFLFSKPVTGAYYWCPPCSNGRLKLGNLLVTS
jgi:putative iron-dependent peroxidase